MIQCESMSIHVKQWYRSSEILGRGAYSDLEIRSLANTSKDPSNVLAL